MDNEKERISGAANLPFGRLVIGALKRLGIDFFVVSPGSRSTPLALAVATLGESDFTVCPDERSASYLALGRVKATRRPVALVCTSGTAGAHYYPAIIEARESGLPLIVLTADRPPELQHCHAGQTIDQKGLYGTYPLFHTDLPLPELDLLLMRQVRELCRRAVEQAMGWPMGPVHLNCPFREPFFTSEESPDGDTDIGSVLEGLEAVSATQAHVEMDISLPERTLILAGPRPWKDPEEELLALIELGSQRGWPILADGVNSLRYGDYGYSSVVTCYDRIARDDALWEALRPDAVLLWGEPPTSKVLRQRLAALDLPGYQIGIGKPGMNPIHGKISWIGGLVRETAVRIDGPSGDYSSKWMAEETKATELLEDAMAKSHSLFEGDVHRLLGKILPEEADVFYTSSLAVRDAEWFMPRRAERLYPFSQRGANGIDGTLSLARGIALGRGKPVYLVSGDLAFLHDSNGLLNAGQQDPGVFVVLLNNSGGGIFELLPVAKRSEHFEQFFATSQKVDFKKLVEAHGGRHSRCEALTDLEFEVNEWNGKGICVAEVIIDRKESAKLHRRFLK